MKISKEGIALIKKFEGIELQAYQDSVGVWTIGYGHTKGVKEGDNISLKQAEEMLEEELVEYEGYINDMVKVRLEQNQFDALVAWVYNLGPTNLGQSTLLKVLNKAIYEEVPYEIKRPRRSSIKWSSAKKRSRSFIISRKSLGRCIN